MAAFNIVTSFVSEGSNGGLSSDSTSCVAVLGKSLISASVPAIFGAAPRACLHGRRLGPMYCLKI